MCLNSIAPSAERYLKYLFQLLYHIIFSNDFSLHHVMIGDVLKHARLEKQLYYIVL